MSLGFERLRAVIFIFQYTNLMQLISDAAYCTSNLRDEPSGGFPVM